MSTSQSSSFFTSTSPSATFTSPSESISLPREISQGSKDSLGSDKDTRPTLLNIPQELRDKIFEYVYGTGADNGRVDVVVVNSREPFVRKATLASHHTLPSKDTLLICRQLYFEMRSMQKALYRQFWTANTFFVSSSQNFQDLEGQQAAFSNDLLHTQHFAIVVEKSDFKYEVNIDLAGASTTTTIRLTLQSVTPHLQVPDGPYMKDQSLHLAMDIFYDQDGRRRTPDSQRNRPDQLDFLPKQFTHMSPSEIGHHINNWR
jgi:hypothetical protein